MTSKQLEKQIQIREKQIQVREKQIQIQKQKDEPMIKQKDARILRECLCRVYRKAPALIKQDIHNELKRYAIAVSSYCKCTDRSFVKDENVFACLDCGTRHQKPLEKDINKIVKELTEKSPI